jgi:hypothetical protein
LGLTERTPVQNLAEVAEPVNARYKHSQTLAFTNLLIYPIRAKASKLLDSCRAERLTDPFMFGSGDIEVRQQYIGVTQFLLNKSLGLPHLVSDV